ncbi:MAG TPA: hypothetical protein VN931_02710 [Fibrobacteria bacterium]|nr:hypothetical protein [Fibrobacteria bacterium]
MMKWIAITVLSSVGGYVGWDLGLRLFSPSSALWLSFIGGLVGTVAGYFVVPRD